MAVEPSPDAGAEHESPPVDMALPAPGEEKQPAVIGTLMQVAPLLWDNDYMARFEEEADQLERRWGLMTAAKALKANEISLHIEISALSTAHPAYTQPVGR